ncbi:MAG: hypothetical protein RJA70_4912, partial [Pseudomonadota bacterium]
MAHQSVLVFNVVGANITQVPEPQKPPETSHGVVQLLYETFQGILPKNVQESFHDASQAKEEAQSLFKYGYLGLRERAQAERLYWACLGKIERIVQRLKFVPGDLQDLETKMSSIYYCNFSVFQSAPDSWAI